MHKVSWASRLGGVRLSPSQTTSFNMKARFDQEPVAGDSITNTGRWRPSWKSSARRYCGVITALTALIAIDPSLPIVLDGHWPQKKVPNPFESFLFLILLCTILFNHPKTWWGNWFSRFYSIDIRIKYFQFFVIFNISLDIPLYIHN